MRTWSVNNAIAVIALALVQECVAEPPKGKERKPWAAVQLSGFSKVEMTIGPAEKDTVTYFDPLNEHNELSITGVTGPGTIETSPATVLSLKIGKASATSSRGECTLTFVQWDESAPEGNARCAKLQVTGTRPRQANLMIAFHR
jgi:hypothetical protein